MLHCFRCDKPVTRIENNQVIDDIEHFLDRCQSDVGEQFVRAMTAGSEDARPDQRVGVDPVVCFICYLDTRLALIAEINEEIRQITEQITSA